MCILCFSFHIVCVGNLSFCYWDMFSNSYNHCLWQPVWLHLLHCKTLKTSDSLACTCVYSARRPRQVFDNELVSVGICSRSSRRIRAAARASFLVYIAALLRCTYLPNCKVYTTPEKTQSHGGPNANPAEEAE